VVVYHPGFAVVLYVLELFTYNVIIIFYFLCVFLEFDAVIDFLSLERVVYLLCGHLCLCCTCSGFQRVRVKLIAFMLKLFEPNYK
jgi:hypothetical protein